MKKILIVDDEKYMRIILSKVLRASGYKVLLAEDGYQALNLFSEFRPRVVLLDYKLPDIDGIEVLKRIKEINSNVAVIMLTAHGNIQNAVSAMKNGAFDYLAKPYNNDELIIIVQKAFETTKLTKEITTLKNKLNEQISFKESMGESSVIKKLLLQIEPIAPTDVTILLEGDTGTGKEWFAQLIHQKSERNKKQFIAVDCGAIPETLFESELFGYERGAFTGAVKNKSGKFEQAQGGTLFLDEINNLPLSMQAKLLRAIEMKAIHRLGGKSPIDLDVRIIAASNRNIINDVNDGNFRSDLFFRISEFKIDIPALSQRTEDIPILVKFFIKKANVKFKKNVKNLNPEAFKLILNHPWPGNIRELKNVINRAVLMTKNDLIPPQDIQFINIRGKSSNGFLLSAATNNTEYEVIKKALEKTNDNKTQAAKLLGISLRQFYRKINKYNI